MTAPWLSPRRNDRAWRRKTVIRSALAERGYMRSLPTLDIVIFTIAMAGIDADQDDVWLWKETFVRGCGQDKGENR